MLSEHVQRIVQHAGVLYIGYRIMARSGNHWIYNTDKNSDVQSVSQSSRYRLSICRSSLFDTVGYCEVHICEFISMLGSKPKMLSHSQALEGGHSYSPSGGDSKGKYIAFGYTYFRRHYSR